MPDSQPTVHPVHPVHLIYHANSGLLNAAWHTAHKLLSPATYSCDLCKLTHGVVAENQAFRDFRQRHPDQVRMWHRDEFSKHYPDAPCPSPCGLRRNAHNEWVVVINAQAIHACTSVEQLIELLDHKITSSAAHPINNGNDPNNLT